MKIFLSFGFLFIYFVSFGTLKDSTVYYDLPDSVKAISFMADISVGNIITKKEIFTGIKTSTVNLSLESDKKEREIVFKFPSGSEVMATGIGVKKEKDELSWKYAWKENENYKLLIATASDSAGNFSLYSGYIFLPNEKKWKLIGTCKILGQWNTMKQPAAFISMKNKVTFQFTVNEAWCQRQNGSWKNLLEKQLPLPVVNLYSHIDSVAQLESEKKALEYLRQMNKGMANAQLQMKVYNDVYYEMLREGTGRLVNINDTVTAFYKGYLFINDSTFDQTKDKPATFPLNRLIKGWQIGVPLCKVGGKIKLIIPSSLAYSIRTRAAKIPPNSILVFEIEVVDAKSPQ